MCKVFVQICLGSFAGEEIMIWKERYFLRFLFLFVFAEEQRTGHTERA